MTVQLEDLPSAGSAEAGYVEVGRGVLLPHVVQLHVVQIHGHLAYLNPLLLCLLLISLGMQVLVIC